jgi:hypothetical protein
MPEFRERITRHVDYWLLAVLLLLIGFQLVFPEYVQEENGLGWDGEVYANMLRDLESKIAGQSINAYYFGRIFPVAIIYGALSVFQLPKTDAVILQSFLLLNISLIGWSYWLWVRICRTLELGVNGRILGFAGIFANYALLKMPFYYPVLMDIPAFAMGLLMLYAYLKHWPITLLVAAFIGAFTFPTLFYCGALLYLFPRREENEFPRYLPEWTHTIIAGLSVVGFVAVLAYIRLVKEKPYINPVNEVVLVISLVLVLAYIFLAVRNLLPPNRVLHALRYRPVWYRAGILLLLFAGIRLITRALASAEEPMLNYRGFIANIVIEAVTNPLVFLVAHFVYFGPVFLLALYYWKPLMHEISRNGTGLYLLALLYVLIGIGSESRQFINAWPVFVVFLSRILEKQTFPRGFYPGILVISLVISKFWFRINTGAFTGELLAFPDQRYFMSQGPWMADSTYGLQAGIALLVFFLLYLVFLNKAKPIRA